MGLSPISKIPVAYSKWREILSKIIDISKIRSCKDVELESPFGHDESILEL